MILENSLPRKLEKGASYIFPLPSFGICGQAERNSICFKQEMCEALKSSHPKIAIKFQQFSESPPFAVPIGGGREVAGVDFHLFGTRTGAHS